jgi:hypothetical protein
VNAQPKFWSDDFDLDLPKVIPDARACLGYLAELELVTHGHETHGRLNHPSVWNHELGSVSFFGRGNPHKPDGYWTRDPIVRCTLWEAVRDAWCHDNVILVESVPVLYGQWIHFEPLMWHTRKWRALPELEVAKHVDAVKLALDRCFDEVERIVR